MCVVDALLEKVEDTVSLGVREFCTRVGITGGNFDRSAENLWKTAGVKLSGEKFRQVVEAEGRRVQRAHAQEQLEFDWCARDCVVKEGAGAGRSRVYMGADGVLLPMVKQQEKRLRRDRIKGKRRRRGKACRKLPPGKAGADQGYKEFKIVTFYDQDQQHRSVGVTCGNHQVAGKLMRRDAARMFLKQADEAIANVDGAEWIVGQAKRQHLPLDAIGLDFYHFSEHVHEARRAVYGEQSEQGDAWAAEMLHTAKHEGYRALWEKLLAWRSRWRGPGSRRAADRLLHYISQREEMIQYPQFIEKGWQIGSGPTESMCKALTLRLKGRGMRWDRDNAEAMMALEGLWQSGQWDTYWNRCARELA